MNIRIIVSAAIVVLALFIGYLTVPEDAKQTKKAPIRKIEAERPYSTANRSVDIEINNSKSSSSNSPNNSLEEFKKLIATPRSQNGDQSNGHSDVYSDLDGDGFAETLVLQDSMPVLTQTEVEKRAAKILENMYREMLMIEKLSKLPTRPQHKSVINYRRPGSSSYYNNRASISKSSKSSRFGNSYSNKGEGKKSRKH